MTIVIKNLPPAASVAELRELFAPYGTVQVEIVAQVQIESEDDQVEWRAIAELGTVELQGHALQLELTDDRSSAIAFPSPDPP